MSPEPGEHLLLAILLSIVCLFLHGWFAAAQSALQNANEGKLRRMAQAKNSKAKRVIRLWDREARFLSTVSFVTLLLGFLSAAFLAWSISIPFGRALGFLPFPAPLNRGIAVALVVLGTACVFLLFGTLIPQKIAAAKPENTAMRTAGLVNGFAVLFRPVTALFQAGANGAVRLLGMNPHAAEQPATEEEILLMLDESEEHGGIEESEKDMIENILDLNDTDVDEIMTHRTEVSAVEESSAIQEVVELALHKGYSRIPVYKEDLDNIQGIVYVKDLLRYVGKPICQNLTISSLMRGAYFVPDSKPCSELFQEMTERKVQIAIIVDEYGGTKGIVTMEDILESIVGNIQDEYDNEEEEICQVNENTFTVDGATSIDEICDLLDMELPEGDYDTIAGMIMERLGNIPEENERPSVRIGHVTFTVQAVEDQRITRLLIVREELPAEEAAPKKQDV